MTNRDDSMEKDFEAVSNIVTNHINNSIYSRKKDTNVFINNNFLNENDEIKDNTNNSKYKTKEEGSINFDNTDNFHHVQVIDEDVENFTRRLDILLRNFRTDSLKDFMSIKRHLLSEQKNIINCEKEKSDSTIISKNNEIDVLNKLLNITKNNLNKENNTKEKLSLYLYNIRTYMKNKLLKSLGF
jgi:hypothetical protein